MEPDYPQAGYALGLALTVKGQYDEAIAEFQRLLAQRPNSPEVRFRLGAALEAKGDRRGALEQFRLACQLAANSPACAEYKRLAGELGQGPG